MTALALLVALVVLLRLPFQIAVLDHWDSVQYALSLDHFDLSVHTPHPPGTPFGILIARVFVSLVGDAHGAFVLMSLFASAAAVVLVFILTNRIFGRTAAWIASLALLTEPPFWMYGAAGNLWTVLAALSALAGLESYRLLRGERFEPILSAVWMGLASGFRLDVTVFLAPMWLWCLWRGRVSAKAFAMSIAIVGLGIGSWLVPVVAMTPGGFGGWLADYVQLFQPGTASPLQILRGLLENTAIIWLYTVALVGPMLGCALLLCRCDWQSRLGLDRSDRRTELLVFFGLWILPSFIFLWIADTTEAGHALLFTVGLLPPVAALLARVHWPRWVPALVVSGVLALQAGIFLFAVPRRDPPGAYVTNLALLRYTAESLRQHEDNVVSMERVIRGRFNPSETLVVTTYGQIPFRFAMFYLPDYTVLRVNQPDGTTLVARKDGIQVVHDECIDASVKSIVWVEEPGGSRLASRDAVPLQSPGSTGEGNWQLAVEDPTSASLAIPGIRRCSALNASSPLPLL